MRIGGRVPFGSPVRQLAVTPIVPTADAGSPCVTETYDGADATVAGYDLPWVTYDASTSGTAIPRVRGEALTIAHTGSGKNATFIAREETDGVSADIVASMRIGALGSRGTGSTDFDLIGYGVWARMSDFAGDGGGNAADPTSFEAGNFVGYHFFVSADDTDSFATLDFAYYNTALETFTGYAARAQLDFTTLGSPIAPGDEIALTVTGTGTATLVVCTINGVEITSIDGTTIEGGIYAGVLSEPLNSTGKRGGVTLLGTAHPSPWASGHDDVIRLDDFSVCPA